MKKFLPRRKLALLVAPFILLTLWVLMLRSEVRGTFSGGCVGEINGVQGLKRMLDDTGGKDIVIAGHPWDSLALRHSKISFSCFGNGDSKIVYYPWPHAISYQEDSGPLKTIYGVTRADIERVAAANGSFSDF